MERKDGTVVWRVRWRQRGRNRSRCSDGSATPRPSTPSLCAAGAPANSRAGRRQGLLSDFGEEWWRLYAEPNLARSTLQVYAVQWDAHVLPRLGSIPLRELSPEVINRFRLELEADGVGPASIRKSLTLLQGVLQRACEWGRIASNPVAPVRKPPVGRARAVVPLAPETVEAIRDWLLRRRLVRDATLVSVLPTPACARAKRSRSRGRTCASARCSSSGRPRSARSGRPRLVGAGPCRLRAARAGRRRMAPSRRPPGRRRARVPGS